MNHGILKQFLSSCIPLRKIACLKFSFSNFSLVFLLRTVTIYVESLGES